MIYTDKAENALPNIPDGFIDLVVTSPPYDNVRSYGQKVKRLDWDFEFIARELSRVLKPGGVICWNVNDMVENGSETLTSAKQKIFFREQCGLLIHDTMIYAKTNFSNPEKTRYHQLFEYVFILSKGKPATFNPIMDKRNAAAGMIGNKGTNTVTKTDGTKEVRPKKVNRLMGMRGNVWAGLTRGQEDVCVTLEHPAMMPRWLARDLIFSFSNPGETVLDPFCGSGTTVIEAMKLGRKYCGIEMNQEYVDECIIPAIQLMEKKQQQHVLEGL